MRSKFMNNQRGIIALLVFIGFSLYLYVNTNNNKKKIRNDRSVAIGQIYNAQAGGKGGLTIDYKYTVNNKQYRGGQTYFEIGWRYANDFINKPILVTYSKSDPNISYSLLTPKDYKEFDFIMPDSMSYVFKYLPNDK